MKKPLILIFLVILFATFLAAFAMDYELAEPIQTDLFSLDNLREVELPSGAIANLRIPSLKVDIPLYDNPTDLQWAVDKENSGAIHTYSYGTCIFDHEYSMPLERLKLNDLVYISYGGTEELYRVYAILSAKQTDNKFYLNGTQIKVPNTDYILACCSVRETDQSTNTIVLIR